MTISNPTWPPESVATDIWQPPWLRYEVEYPDSGRKSRLVAHQNVPYVADISADEDLEAALTIVASRYLGKAYDLIAIEWKRRDPGDPEPKVPALIPASWRKALAPDVKTRVPATMEWLKIWPPVGDSRASDGPPLASWNLSRQPEGSLPATVVMTAAEVYYRDGNILSYAFGVRVPMAVENTGSGGVRVIIRSMTAEGPADGYISWTEALDSSDSTIRDGLTAFLDPETGEFDFDTLQTRITFRAESGFLDPDTLNTEQLLFFHAAPKIDGVAGILPALDAKGAAAKADDQGYSLRPSFPKRQSFQIVSTFKFPNPPPQVNPPISTEVCPLVTHAAHPGQADVFVQTPPGWIDPAGQPYLYTLRRPTRTDEVLEIYRSTRDIGPPEQDFELKGDGFEVRRCPQYVPGDEPDGEGIKSVPLPGGTTPLPRRNDFAAVMAYCHSADFFRLLAEIGLTPDTFVVRAQKQVEIFYRYGIFPGPGRDGRTINAQVAFDCTEAKQGIKPKINMHLALATLNRWSRPPNPDKAEKHPDRRFLRPEPLGIAASGRWMLHEFGHYLIAARLGKLEFDFAHSAGDAMAAVWYDPYSQLNDTREDVSGRFRGITYPFVFSTRRHDRSPLLGWAWYGALNRSVVERPPANCETLKGYLTEQILSSTIFRLYRALGGDTLRDGKPDGYIRYRASFMTLFLLIRAIAGFAQPPSRAEMLELGMEEAGLLMTAPVAVPRPLHETLDSGSELPPGDTWTGGVTHKVVRWAFEAQGMFVEDVRKTTNGPGRAPAVDIYVRDQRPTEEILPGGTTRYGPGSYVPVSLDWTGDRAWMVKTSAGFKIGNRGRLPAPHVRLRWWLGRLLGNMTDVGWEFGDNIDWKKPGHVSTETRDLGNGTEEVVEIPAEVTDSMDTAATSGAAQFVILLEVSCDDDLANTDPAALLAPAIDATDRQMADTPPVKPRALTDLVAGDNNLGLMLV